ncbi:F-box domain-containing protein [Mycena kentingensis (nom. inval.)]|nr:F-box domain-containing protein [Mycena kentingensis (nom. inval.)]
MALRQRLASVIFPGSANPPMLLTQVSSAWRELALATPRLWTTLTIRTSHPNLAPILSMWLPRSGILSLKLELNGLCASLFLPGPARDAIQPHLHRIEHLTIRCYPGATALDDRALLDLNAAFPVDELRGLQSVQLGRYLLAPGAVTRIQFLQHHPSLRDVHLDSIPTTDVDLPWAQLTAFTITGDDVEEYGDALRLAENVTHSAPTILQNPERDMVPTTHQKLRHLSLIAESFDENPHFLCGLTLPALETLELFDSDHIQSADFDAFIKRSSARLKTLVFSPNDLQYNLDIGSFELEQLRNLTRLELRHCTTTLMASFLRSFGEGSRFLPNLEKLVIECTVERDLVEESRWNADSAADYSFLVRRVAEGVLGRDGMQGVPKCWVHLEARQSFLDYSTSTTPSKQELALYESVRRAGGQLYLSFQQPT